MSDRQDELRGLPGQGPAIHSASSRRSVFVAVFVLSTLVLQRIGFAVLGEGPARALFLDGLTLLVNLLAIGFSLGASRRDHGHSRIFWLLFGSALSLQLIGNAGWAWIRSFHVAIPENSLFPSLFYRLAAAPLAIALFLSEENRSSRLGSFLDSCMVVGLVSLTTYQVQMAELSAHDPKIWQLITVGTAVNAVIVLAATARFLFSSPGCLHGLFARQATYLSIYLCVSLITSLADAYLPSHSDSVDLIWILPYLSALAIAFAWRPVNAEGKPSHPRISRRTSLLCFNLTLATMVLGSAILGLRLVNATRVAGLVAVAVVLFAFAVRSALMQDTQERTLLALQDSRAQLQHQALYDELTGLPNRRLFLERIAQVLAIARRDGNIAAVLYLDLDGFKPVNDKFGHLVGDLVLKRVADRMLSRVRKSDTLARMGGDEFTWLLSQLSGKEQAFRLGKEMLATLSEPIEIGGHTILLTASIGIGFFPEGATDAASLIEQADSAMYAVKQDGKNGVRHFTPDLSNIKS
jgi:diguanylate cyclase (GGDEF)-like protein